MRIATRILCFLLPATVAVSAAAQSAPANPLMAQIRAQQAVVAQAPGSSDGEAWLRLAVLEQDAARFVEAERAYNRTLELLRTGNPAALATALDHASTLYVETGRYAQAEPLARKALALRQDSNDSHAVGVSYMHLAVLDFGRKKLADAEADAEKAVSLLDPDQSSAGAGAATPVEQMSALIDLSLVRCAAHHCAQAMPELDRALALAHAHYVADSVPVGFLDFLMGYAEWKSGSPVAAAGNLRRGTAELGTKLGWGHPTYIAALRQYKAFLTQTGRTRQAAEVEETLGRLGQHSNGDEAKNQRAELGLGELP